MILCAAYINKIARFRGTTTENILDLVFTDDNVIVKVIKLTDLLGRSDHGCVNFV